MSWYDNSWLYHIKITISHAKIDSNLTDHPVLITETNMPDHFWTHVKANGSDIVVTESDETTKLKRELVSINTSTKKMELWVKTDLSSSANTIIYLYYGNAAATETNDAATWDDNFKMVYHMNQNPAGGAGCILDSSGNGEHGTPAGGMGAGDRVDAIIGKGLDFDGVDDEIIMDTYFGIGAANPRTVELWLNADSGHGGNRPLVCWGKVANGEKWVLRIEAHIAADIETLRPNGVGNSTMLNQQPAPGLNYDKVDEVVADGDDTYVYTVGGWIKDTYDIPESSVGAGVINSVTVKCRARRTAVGLAQLKCVVRTHGADYEGAVQNVLDAYANYSKVWATNPDTAGAWTWDEVNAMEIGCNVKSGALALRVTQVWVEVDYDFDGRVARTEVQGGFERGFTEIQDDAWHYLAQLFSGANVTDVEHYVDSVLNNVGGSGAIAVDTDIVTNEVEIAGWAGAFNKVIIDEVRISNSKRSEAYLKANYFNVTDIANFYSMEFSIRSVSDYLISDDWILLYYDTDHWVDITEYVKKMTHLRYDIDNRVQGAGTILNIVLNDAATYGTGKYALGIGTDYFYFGAPYDGIEVLETDEVSIMLGDYLLYKLDGKTPLNITGKGGLQGIASADITSKSMKDFLTEYKTSQHNIDITGFTSRDLEHWTDGLGNQVEVSVDTYNGNVLPNTRYATKGVIYGKDQETKLGEPFVKIEDILDNIIAGEGLSLNVNYGYGDESKGTCIIALPADIKKVWDAAYIKRYSDDPSEQDIIIVLYSKESFLHLSSFDLDGVLLDTMNWASKDWDELANGGPDNLGYKIYPFWHGMFYIPMWHCANYDSAGITAYDLHMVKLYVDDVDGSIVEMYDEDIETISPGFSTADADARDNYRDRETRYVSGNFNCFHLHVYRTAAGGVGQRFISAHQLGVATDKVNVVDVDKFHDFPLSDWYYQYTSDENIYHLAPDDENGSVVLLSQAAGVYTKETFRVDMPALTAGHAVHSNGGLVVEDDDPTGWGGGVYVSTMWREAIHTNSPGTVEHFYLAPQMPNGILFKNRVGNKYIKAGNTNIYFDFVPYNDSFAGSQWDLVNDIAFLWKTDLDDLPNLLTWQNFNNYVYRRLHLYQPFAYMDRKHQFMDAFVTYGFFYQQKNDNVNLIRIRGTGTSMGTLSDELFSKTFQGFSRFAEEFTIKILDRRISFQSGDRKKEIKTLMGEYGWVSPNQVKFYTDWVERINGIQEGVEVHMNLDAFKSITSTYVPDLGKTFIFDSTTYILIGAKIDLENWVIEVTGIKDI